MNRAERRRLAAETDNKTKFINSLTPIQKKHIDDITRTTKQNALMEVIGIFDVCLTGALIEKTNLDLSEIFDINKLTVEFITETYKLNSTMGVNKRMEGLQKIEQECIALIKDLIKEGKQRGEIVKLVKEKYKGTGMTTPEINITYKKILNDMLETQKTTDNIQKQCLIEEDDTIVANNEISNNKEESCVVEHNLKVIRKELKVKGDYGTYEVHDDFLIVGGNTVCKSKEDIKSYIEKEVSELQKQIDVLKASANEMFAVFEQFV